MEEDIKKFLKLVKEIKTIYTGDEIIPEDVPIEAIENLIARNGELEEENKEIKKEFALNTEIHKRDEIIKDLKETINCLHETDKENYISKSKVIEKIEELKNGTYDAKIILQQLLKE